jgi:hypothetical protein
MNSDEVIFAKIHDNGIYDQLLKDAINYAIISIPFTFDRMGIRDLKKKITNIAKGKLAENLFFFHLTENNIAFDQKITSTPFYTVDKRDFILKGKEWDIKNNYLIHEEEILPKDEYIELLGLIPHRGEWDQWGKRNQKFFSQSTSTAYVFTFMQKNRSKAGDDFFSIQFSFKQEIFLRDLYEKFEGKKQQQSPYETKWFWDAFEAIDGPYTFTCQYRPQMVITGVALPETFNDFTLYKPSQVTGRYMRTIIPNMGIPIKKLKSFQEFIKDNE